MTNWAPDYTPRCVIKYRSAGLPHTWTTRAARGTASGSLVPNSLATLDAIVAAMDSILCDDFAVESVFFIEQDTDLQIPFAFSPLTNTGTVAISAFSSMDKATEIRFPGKSLGGLVTHLSIFGAQLSMDSTTGQAQSWGLLPASVSAEAAGAIAALQGSDFYANDNRLTVWYNYATCSVNDHWWKEARKSGGL